MRNYRIIAGTFLLTAALLTACGTKNSTMATDTRTTETDAVEETILQTDVSEGNRSAYSNLGVEAFSGVESEEDRLEAARKDILFTSTTEDGTVISGSIRQPEDFTEGTKYPVAILSHGILGDRNQGGLFTGLADSLEEIGYVSVRFDFDGYGESGGSLKNNSLKTEEADLKAVIDYVKTLDYVDTNQINLVGFSMGGAVTSMVAGELTDEIHSVVLWAPAAVIADDSAAGRLLDAQIDVDDIPDEIPVMGGQYTFGKAFFEDSIGLDIYGIAEEYTGPVLILQGDADKAVPMSYAEKYNEVYENSTLKVIKDGEHVFTGDALQEVIKETTTFLKENNFPVSDIFHAEKIADHITRIHGLAGELMYLVEGTDKAALIDTGSGVGNLREYVEQITDKPVIVLLTHGHLDHASGAVDFDEVYMNHADDEVYAAHDKLEMRKEFLRLAIPEQLERLQASDFAEETSSDRFKQLNDGDTFDLGGVTLTAYSFPGHTPGMMAILFNEANILLTGDGANNSTFLFDRYALGLKTYESSLETLKTKTNRKYNKIIYSHGTDSLSVDFLDDMISLCEDIRTGNVDDIPMEFMGDKGYLAKQTDDKGVRIDGGIGNIVYSKEKINQ